MKELEIKLRLQMFAEGAAGGGDGAAAGSNAAQGEGAEAAEGAEAPDLFAQFKEDVRGKYKEPFGKAVGEAVQARVKNLKQVADRYNAMAPALEMLAERYDLAMDDPKLIEAIANDKDLLSAKALKNGRSTEDEMAMAKARAESQRAVRIAQGMLAKQQMEQWTEQAKRLQADYPAFDLDKELEDPRFQRLLQDPNLNLDVESAFMALHGSDVTSYRSQKAADRVAASVAANKARPKENANGAAAAGGVHKSVSGMSRAEFKDLQQRAARGEKIIL